MKKRNFGKLVFCMALCTAISYQVFSGATYFYLVHCFTAIEKCEDKTCVESNLGYFLTPRTVLFEQIPRPFLDSIDENDKVNTAEIREYSFLGIWGGDYSFFIRYSDTGKPISRIDTYE